MSKIFSFTFLALSSFAISAQADTLDNLKINVKSEFVATKMGDFSDLTTFSFFLSVKKTLLFPTLGHVFFPFTWDESPVSIESIRIASAVQTGRLVGGRMVEFEELTIQDFNLAPGIIPDRINLKNVRLAIKVDQPPKRLTTTRFSACGKSFALSKSYTQAQFKCFLTPLKPLRRFTLGTTTSGVH